MITNNKNVSNSRWSYYLSIRYSEEDFVIDLKEHAANGVKIKVIINHSLGIYLKGVL